MFNGKSKSDSTTDRSAHSTNLVGAGTQITGDMSCTSSMRIDGNITGNIESSAKVIVGPSGVVEGNITALQVDIMGKVNGHIVVKELLQLKDGCEVTGNITAGKLLVDPTAIFNGHCNMGAAIVSGTKTNDALAAV